VSRPKGQGVSDQSDEEGGGDRRMEKMEYRVYEFNNLYSSPVIISVIKSMRMG
jgi:hypothetical protein